MTNRRPDSAAPDDVRDLVEEGIRLFNARQPLEARRTLEGAVKRNRKAIAAWTNLGVTCELLGDVNAANHAFRTAAGLDPDSAVAQHGLGLVAMRVADFERAELYLRNAIRIDPVAGYYNNLSIVLRSLGNTEESDACLRKAVELAPDDASMHSNLVLYLNYSHGHDGARLRAEADAWARRHGDRLMERSRLDFATRDQSRERRLRVGYVSPDLRLHAVTFFLQPLLAAHDRDAVEIHCYSDAPVADDVTRRIRAGSDGWCEAHELDDVALTRRILDDKIDVLVDLAGHTGRNRMTMFARRAAPVQVSYLGYLGTTGLRTMDYRFTDAIADPAGATEAFSSEALVPLTGGIFAYTGNREAPITADPPSRANGVVTFGSFNALQKMNDETLRRWSRVLAGVAGSRLCLKAFGLAEEGHREALRQRFAAQGGDPARLIPLAPESDVASHLARYNSIDIALDTFPYNGITTTFEALWMGVPVVTLAGATQVSRFGASTMTHVGLADLVAQDDDAYVTKAIALARDAVRLSELRRTLRDRMASSTLCDGARLARAIEAAYRRMWLTWCDEVQAKR
jgi:protein O-GlcNAc transferase